MNIFEITNGEDTVNFLSDEYSLLHFSPAISYASDKMGMMYADVDQRLTITVKNYAAMQKLMQLLDQSQRWGRGEKVNAVQLKYQPTPTSRVWVCLIVGLLFAPATLPGNYALGQATGIIDNVEIVFQRRGQWLTPDQTNLITNGGFENGIGGVLDDWNVSGDGTAKQHSDFFYEGEHSAKIDGTTGSVDLWQKIEGLPNGATVAVTGRVLIEQGVAFINFWGVGGSTVNLTSASDPPVWQYFELLATVGTFTDSTFGTVTNGVVINFVGEPFTPAKWYVDDVRAYLIDESGKPGDVATATAVANGDVATLVFGTGAEKFPSPTKIYLTGWRYGTRHPRSFLIVANGTNKIINVNAGALIMGGQFSSVTDTAAFARANTIMRYTPVNTAAQSISFITYSVTFSQFKNVAIFANVRNNSATTSFTVWAQSFTPSGGNVKSQIITIPGNATPAPYWISLGNLPLGRLSTFLVYVQASAASGSLDIDEFVVVSMDDGLTSVISIDPAMSIFSGLSATVVANHGALSLLVPRVEIEYDGQIDGWSASGDIAVYTNAPTIEAILLATGGDTSANRWRQVASAAVIENNWTASRLPGRLIPE